MRGRAIASAVGAIVALLAIGAGVPALLLVLVGNPWPGRTRVELGDEVAIIVGLLAVAAWLLWARFVLAVALEGRDQLAELRRWRGAVGGGGTDGVVRPVELVAPVASRQGVGLLAQRLVAAALVLLPVAGRAVPSVAETPPARLAEQVPIELFDDAPMHVGGADSTATNSVTVHAGDTLIGLARTHLGEGERWREIFELNRERALPDGRRLVSPSGLQVGMSLDLPASALPAAPPPVTPPPAPYLAPATLTVQPGDNLWELTEDRLAAGGLPVDSATVAGQLELVIQLNAGVLEDPNLIYVGERIEFPAVGSPPIEPAPEVAPAELATQPAVAAGPSVQPPPVGLVEVPPGVDVPINANGNGNGRASPPASTTTAAATPLAPTASTTTSTMPRPRPPEVDDGGQDAAATDVGDPSSPSPIGIGEAALLSAGVLALVASRRRLRLRASRPRARVPAPPPGTVATERRLRAVDADERLLRVDVAVRAAAATLVDGPARISIVRAGPDGLVELFLSRPFQLPSPWEGAGTRWILPGSTTLESMAPAARQVGAPCVALAQLGVDLDGREVLADLESLGLLSVAATPELADAVVRGIAATLAASIFAEVANLVGVGLDEDVFLDHRQSHHSAGVDEALELATTLVGTTASAAQTTFALRARHTSGEAWEPAVVLTASSVADEVTADVVEAARQCRGGLALVAAGELEGAEWTLRPETGTWRLEPLEMELTPVGLTARELHDLHDVLVRADAPLVEIDRFAGDDVDGPSAGPYVDGQWTLLVRLLGPVEVVDRHERSVRFERSKSSELVAWLTLHRERSTRSGARTALWDLDVRDATFANVVSEARRAMARHIEPPIGEEWLGRTLTEVLPLHRGVVADVDLVQARLDHAKRQPPEMAIETLRPAVELIRDLPFAGTGFLWPDAEGITSNLVLLGTGAATELACHYLTVGDVPGVFWATGQGLKVLPGHEELIALRMRAHAAAGDLSGVRQEWECYERVLNADPWSDGEPAPKLVLLRRQLLAPS